MKRIWLLSLCLLVALTFSVTGCKTSKENTGGVQQSQLIGHTSPSTFPVSSNASPTHPAFNPCQEQPWCRKMHKAMVEGKTIYLNLSRGRQHGNSNSVYH